MTHFPMWLGTLPELQILSLRSNKLHGSIRTSRMKNMSPQFQIVNLSYNVFLGKLIYESISTFESHVN